MKRTSAPKKPKLTLKSILQRDKNWWRFRQTYSDRIRDAITSAVTNLLSCGLTVRGYNEYSCENPKCPHTKRVAFTCKNRLCSSCGRKATAIWIEKQTRHFPEVPYQHITFTMPCEFWNLFWCNRHLLNAIGAMAADCVKTIAKDKNITPGIFLAIHTFGRDLKRNVHIHLCITLGGLAENNTKWLSLPEFDRRTLMPFWRKRIVQLFRKHYKKGDLQLPAAFVHLRNDYRTFNKFLETQSQKHWHVHCAKPENDHKRNTEYLGRYIKRPAIANSRLTHYSGADVQFRYLDHKTKRNRLFKCSTFAFIRRVIQHIPDKNFRLIRYYGFLANAVRGKLLPLVNDLLGLIPKEETTGSMSYAKLAQQTFNFNPLECILCGSNMRLSHVIFGATQTELLRLHEPLALMKACR